MTQPPNAPPPPPAQPPQSEKKRSLIPVWTGIAGIVVGGLIGGGTVALTTGSGGQNDGVSDALAQPEESEAAGETDDRPGSGQLGDPQPLGTPIETDGFTLTVFEYKTVSDSDTEYGAIDVEICVTDIGTDEVSMATVDPSYWSVVDDEGRLFSYPSSQGMVPDATPEISYQDVYIGECARGWLLTEADSSTNVQTVRYSKPADDYTHSGRGDWLIQ